MFRIGKTWFLDENEGRSAAAVRTMAREQNIVLLSERVIDGTLADSIIHESFFLLVYGLAVAGLALICELIRFYYQGFIIFALCSL